MGFLKVGLSFTCFFALKYKAKGLYHNTTTPPKAKAGCLVADSTISNNAPTTVDTIPATIEKVWYKM